MMWSEFVDLSGLDVTYRQYTDIIEPMYMAVPDMDKAEFVAFIKPSVKVMLKKAEQSKPKDIRRMLLRVAGTGEVLWYEKTPNGCWYMINYVWLRSADKKTGKYIVSNLSEADIDKLIGKGVDLRYSSEYDLDENDCIWK